jgi:replicative DNA helicase
MQYRLSFFNHKRDNVAKPRFVGLDWLLERAATPELRAQKDGPLFSPATFKSNKRAKEGVRQLAMLVVDCDGGLSFQKAVELWSATGAQALIHTTWSHARIFEGNLRGEEKWRAIIPFLEPATPEQYERAWEYANQVFENQIDHGARDTSRMFYLPARVTEEAPYEYAQLAGEPLNPLFPGPDQILVDRKAYALSALAREITLVSQALEGERNTRLSKAGFSLGGFVATGDLELWEVRSMLEQAGLASGLPPKEVMDCLDGALKRGMALPRGEDPEKEKPSDWIPAVELLPARGVPAFPSTELPFWLQQYADEVSHETQVPREGAALFGLSVISAAVAPDTQVRVRGNWIEPLNIYAILALLPAQRKSAVWSAMVKPLQEYEAQLIEESKPIIARAKAARIRRQAKLESLRRNLAKDPKGKDNEKLEAEIEELALQLELLGEPVAPQLICDDVTPEALATILHQQGGAVALLSAEGGLFDQLAGRYTDGLVNLDVFLKGHSGDMLRINRRDRNEIIPNPRLTMALAVQPAVLRAAAQKPEFRQRGLLARFLYAMPTSNLGFRQIAAQGASLRSREAYGEAVVKLKSSPKMAFLELSEEAGQILEAWEVEIEKTIRPDGSHADISDWIGKLAGQTVRLAGLIHLADNVDQLNPWPLLIPGDVMERAVRFAQYFQAAAQEVFVEMKRSRHIEDCRAIATWAKRRPEGAFSAREIRMHMRRRFTDMDAITEVLEFMCDEGWMRPIGKKGGFYQMAPSLPEELS